MCRFKIGEKVIPKRDLVDRKKYGNLTCQDCLHIHRRVVIVETHYNGSTYPGCFRDQNGTWWHDSMVERVYNLTKENINKIKDTSNHFLDMMS